LEAFGSDFSWFGMGPGEAPFEELQGAMLQFLKDQMGFPMLI